MTCPPKGKGAAHWRATPVGNSALKDVFEAADQCEELAFDV
jgi:hypothetical protein